MVIGGAPPVLGAWGSLLGGLLLGGRALFRGRGLRRGGSFLQQIKAALLSEAILFGAFRAALGAIHHPDGNNLCAAKNGRISRYR